MDEKKDKQVFDFSQMLKKGTESDTKFQKRQYSPYPFEPKIIQWLIKYSGGLIKNPRQASYLLLGFLLITIIISLYLVFGTGRQNIIDPEEAKKYLESP